MSFIRIEFYDEAFDEMDASGQKPKRVYNCHTIEEAMLAVGLIERHETISLVEDIPAVKDF